MKELTPMMQQYKKIKSEYPDAVLFFRVGDFYETFFDDAITASRELEITLTSRNGNKDDAIPLAGVPYHAANNYMGRLLQKGYKVAICDQVEEASQASGLVKREVTRVITPGTRIEDNFLEKDRNNYLAAISKTGNGESLGLTFIDISTGELQVFHIEHTRSIEKVFDEISRLKPTEIVIDEHIGRDKDFQIHLNKHKKMSLINIIESFSNEDEPYRILKEQFSAALLEDSKLTTSKSASFSTALAFKYIKKMQKCSLSHLGKINFSKHKDFLSVDSVTTRNLEISESILSREKKNSLLGVLDRTKTSMGARLLRKWLERPLLRRESMEARWDAIEELKDKQMIKSDLAELLKRAYDLERLSGRITMGLINPKDLLALKKTLLLLPQFILLLNETHSTLLQRLRSQVPELSNLFEELQKAIKDDAPFSLKEGGIFKEGYSEEVDKLRNITGKSKSWILELEKIEKERSGIRSLKVGFNKVFGYYIEVTRANLDLVPLNYIRKQTLVNSERFITEELKEKESLILNAEDKLGVLEYKLFEELRLKVCQYTNELQLAGEIIATIDCIFSLSDAASAYGYIRPAFASDNSIYIKGGRHPVVERIQDDEYISNDLYFNEEKEGVLIITGPNMAGKSTFCRSIALLLIMAQAGSFVPADEISFCPVDHIFARVGASDDLSSGRSTFMVEMEETATILREATPKSLVILDEIGRGTSTYDGMSLAQAILEYLHNHIRAKVLFSTHYHELTSLDEELERVKNLTVSVKEKGEEVIFLRKIVPGKADKSYGINVARMAGLPDTVISRAYQILKKTEEAQLPSTYKGQLTLLKSSPENHNSLSKKEKRIIQEIRELNIVNITPLEALNKLYKLQSQVSLKE
ncbi:MAG: DNA mismatch repair protein MutS [Bacillota bacterium]|nr:DNA mismatch repair protein MutS [Bacillota bacterium]